MYCDVIIDTISISKAGKPNCSCNLSDAGLSACGRQKTIVALTRRETAWRLTRPMVNHRGRRCWHTATEPPQLRRKNGAVVSIPGAKRVLPHRDLVEPRTLQGGAPESPAELRRFATSRTSQSAAPKPIGPSMWPRTRKACDSATRSQTCIGSFAALMPQSPRHRK